MTKPIKNVFTRAITNRLIHVSITIFLLILLILFPEQGFSSTNSSDWRGEIIAKGNLFNSCSGPRGDFTWPVTDIEYRGSVSFKVDADEKANPVPSLFFGNGTAKVVVNFHDSGYNPCTDETGSTLGCDGVTSSASSTINVSGWYDPSNRDAELILGHDPSFFDIDTECPSSWLWSDIIYNVTDLKLTDGNVYKWSTGGPDYTYQFTYTMTIHGQQEQTTYDYFP